MFPNQQQKIGTKACGPVCLLNVYKHFRIKKSLDEILRDLKIDDKITTYPAQLATHLIGSGLKTVFINSSPFVIYPSWSGKPSKTIADRLQKWIKLNKSDRWLKNSRHLLSYLNKNGEIMIIDLTTEAIDNFLDKGYLLICCLEESWIWGERKIPNTNKFDDVKGKTRGHYVILYGKDKNNYLVSDPFPTGLKNREGLYSLDKAKLLVATLVWTGQIIAVKK